VVSFVEAGHYGVGKTQYQTYRAIINNGTVYVIAFIAYLTNVWTPTFTSIMILFGIGIVVDSILTVYYAFRVLFPLKPGKTTNNLIDSENLCKVILLWQCQSADGLENRVVVR